MVAGHMPSEGVRVPETYAGSGRPPSADDIQNLDIQNLLRATIDGPDAVRVGTFVLALDPASDHPYRNYAVPVADGPITGSAVTALIDAFRTRGLVPRRSSSRRHLYLSMPCWRAASPSTGDYLSWQ